ncbi:MAG TPA: DcaP family trimeric outer membrane transporter [Phnomibacter sp.]|nr:DcaP family trimeric outer membrane transporter [Phnomibacter sp.]
MGIQYSQRIKNKKRTGALFLQASCLLAVILTNVDALAQPADSSHANKPPKKVNMEIFGFILTNVIYDFKQSDPKWFDAPRPTKLPAYKNQYAPDGNLYFGIRFTRVGLRTDVATPLGALKTLFEFDLYGSGPEVGQTAFHIRHAYGELGKFGIGQTWSPFMDVDVFPNSLELFEPCGAAFARNIQLRYTPIQNERGRLSIALEKPGGTADEGIYAEKIELKNTKPHLNVPDLTADYHAKYKWGYVELGGLLKELKWEDLDTLGKDYSGHKAGWGFNLSSGITIRKKDKLHLQVMYGKGIESYIRDAPADVGVEGTSISDVEGVALPVTSFVGFYDHSWNKKFSSTIGYSFVKIKNSNGQAPNAFKMGEYALANIMYTPFKDLIFDLGFIYTKRTNYSDGWSANGPRLQFNCRLNFSQKLFGDQ